jgi:hypothetical protein
VVREEAAERRRRASLATGDTRTLAKALVADRERDPATRMRASHCP